MARSLLLFDRLVFVSIQSARLTGDGTDLAMDESVAFLRMHGVEVDYKLQKNYRPRIPVVRDDPVNLPPIPMVYDDPVEAEDPVAQNDDNMDEDDYFVEEEVYEEDEEDEEDEVVDDE
jgi:hypothetical protein